MAQLRAKRTNEFVVRGGYLNKLIDERYTSLVHELSSVGVSAQAVHESICKMMSNTSVDQIAWEQLEKKPKIEVKGEKRNGSMSRQQAFGELFKK